MDLSLYTLLTSEYSLAESLELAAAAGFDAVDLRQGRDDDDPVHLRRDLSDHDAEQVRQQVEAAGLRVSGLTTYYALGQPQAESLAERRGLRRAFQLAQILGAPCLRCSGPPLVPGVSYETSRSVFRQQVGEMSALASLARVTLTIEQHSGSLFCSAGQILDMLRGLHYSTVGIVYDPGNCLWEGYERPAVQLDMLGDRIRAVHVKNAMSHVVESPVETLPAEPSRLDQGLLDWPAIVAQLAAQGYAGYLTLEDFYGGFDSVAEKLAWDVAYLRGILPPITEEDGERSHA
jgi:sugar phosphate isomerase/epimerase